MFFAASLSAFVFTAFAQGQSSTSGAAAGGVGTSSSQTGAVGTGQTKGTTGSSQSMGNPTSPSAPVAGAMNQPSSGAPGQGTGASSPHSGPGAMGAGQTPGTTGSSHTMGSPATSSTPGASAMNRSGSTMTDQATSDADRTLNQKLRQGLISDSTLETSSRHIYFSTDNGAVTLQGTVPTEQAKKDVENKIEKMSGVKKVENQLKVMSSTSSSTTMGGTSATGGMDSTTSTKHGSSH